MAFEGVRERAVHTLHVRRTFRLHGQRRFRMLVHCVFSPLVRRTFQVRQDQHAGLAVIASDPLKLASQRHLPDRAVRLVQACSGLHVRAPFAAVMVTEGLSALRFDLDQPQGHVAIALAGP